MAISRQVQLWRGTTASPTTLDLNATPYAVVAGSWASSGTALELRLIVLASTLAEMDRYTAELQRWLTLAAQYDSALYGAPVYVYTKTCDAIATVAELGATWLRKRVTGGSVLAPDVSESAAGQYSAVVMLSLQVDELWQRAAPESILAATGAVSTNSNGGVTVPASGYLTARRMTWTAAGGVTVRVRWVYADADVTFVNFSDSYGAKALYQASDNKLYIYDCGGNSASSSALTATAGDEIDLVFKWDPSTPKMGIWVNGTANGSAAACYLIFGTTGSELMTNGGFETKTGTDDDGTSDTFGSWADIGVDDGAGLKIESTTTKYAGTRALKISGAAGLPYIYQGIGVTAGKTYRLSFYTRGDASHSGNYLVYDLTHSADIVTTTATLITGTSYTNVIKAFTAPAGCSNIAIILYPAVASSVVYFDTVSLLEIDAAANVDTYTLISPTGSAQTVYEIQVWPTPLTDAQCAGLNAWGRPEPELAFYVAPSDTKNTNAAYRLYNIPGDAEARLRLLLSDATQAYDQFKIGLRPLRIPTTCLWECESGTNGTDVADTADATASAGNVARFTPTATTTVTRSTLVLAADPDDVAALYGQHRLYLACNDAATSVRVNTFAWRLLVAGIAGEWSDDLAVSAVSQYSLVDCGILDIPPGDWPDEMASCTTDVHAGSYVTLEFRSSNTVGSGGGTLDFDAVYLAPAEREGTVLNTTLTTAQYLLLDWSQMRPSAVVVASPTSLEFAGYATYTGDDLVLSPIAGDAGLLWLYGLRNNLESARANDAVTLQLYVTPTWA